MVTDSELAARGSVMIQMFLYSYFTLLQEKTLAEVTLEGEVAK